MARRISIDGCGMITPVAAGNGETVLSAAAALGERFKPNDRKTAYWAIADDRLADHPDFGPELQRDRAAWITAAALSYACADANLSLIDVAPDRIALVLGSAFAGQLGMIQFANEVRAQSARFVSPIHFPQTVGNYVAGAMARAFKIRGPNMTIAGGPPSGLQAIITACSLLSDGAADVAVAGGFEVLSNDLVLGLGGSEFGETNAGVWSEGACLYVLRRADDAAPTPAPPTIVDWSASGTGDDTYGVADSLGRSLAAESAMRLAAAMLAKDPQQQRSVRQRSADGQTASIVVEVPPRRT